MELEARRIQAAYKTASNELEKLDEMTEKDLLKVIAAKTYNDRRKTKHFAFEFVVWLGKMSLLKFVKLYCASAKK